VPPDDALDEKFDLNKFQGRWYITAGLNPLFDTFPCQEHYFGVPKPGAVNSVDSTSFHVASFSMRQPWVRLAASAAPRALHPDTLLSREPREACDVYTIGWCSPDVFPAGKLYGRINWRIPKGSNDDFLERTTIQTFDQQDKPGVLFNHNNECVSVVLHRMSVHVLHLIRNVPSAKRRTCRTSVLHEC
jgi:VDE lipocalin domain